MPDGIMASYASMALITEYKGSYFENSYNSNITLTKNDTDYYTKMQESTIYSGKKETQMKYYYCQAQKTYSSGGTPTVEDRKKAINDVLAKAKDTYNNSHHDALFQLGIGGSQDDDQSTVASSLNTYVQTAIENKLLNNDVSPLGFVLMNYCLSYKDLLNDILSFNTKFSLNRDANKEEWPDDCGGNPYDELYGTEW